MCDRLAVLKDSTTFIIIIPLTSTGAAPSHWWIGASLNEKILTGEEPPVAHPDDCKPVFHNDKV